ncbi:MAG: hypothetical protein U0M21_00685, partial [Emergencia sp.]|nr:hypothetical protein [Emergencia sp.]
PDPEEPGDKPDTPTDPEDKPTKPEEPKEDGNGTNQDGDKADQNGDKDTSDEGQKETPKTGDTQGMGLWTVLLCMAGLATVAIGRRKTEK